jgi:hypothetical protein
MHLPRFTIGSFALVVAALGVALASLKGNHLWFIGLSMMTIIGLLGAAIGANDLGRARPAAQGRSSVFPRI